MKKIIFSTLFLIGFIAYTFSQKEIKVESYLSSELIPVFVPIQTDSLNTSEKNYSDKELLSTQVDFKQALYKKQVLKTDSGSIATLPFFDWDSKKPKQDKAIQILSFNIDADRFCKAKLSVTSTEMFEIYVDGEKGKSKETKETELSKSKEVTVDLKLQPRQYTIYIKRLATFRNFDKAEIQSVIKLEKQDTLAQITLSTSDKRKISTNDMLEGTRVTDASISPSGKYYTATFTTVDNTGKRTTNFELREFKNNKLIYNFPSYARPYWMPSSDRIIYHKDGIKNKNFYVFNVADLSENLIAEEVEFDWYKISPDETYMILSCDESIKADKSVFKRHLSPSDRTGSYRKRTNLFKYDFNKKMKERLTFGHTSVYICDISHDSKFLLFMASKEELKNRLFGDYKLYNMNIYTAEIDTIADDPFISDASFSPDDKQLLITGSGDAFNGIGLNIKDGQISNNYDKQIFLMDLKSKEVSTLSKNFNPSISKCHWSKIDNKIYMKTDDEDRTVIYSFNPKNNGYKRLGLKEDMIGAFDIADNSLDAVYTGQSLTNSTRLYSIDLKSDNVRLLADPYAERLSGIAVGKIEDWNFTTSDSTLIKGRCYYPVDFDPNKKYPMIVYYYAGVHATTRVFDTNYPLHVFASLGYIVYTLQPSGAVGFGQEFSARHVNAWGEPAAQEIIEGTQKFCDTHSFVDKTKIGCIGASYGGFMTQYVLTKTNIFATGISHAGISSIASYWGEGYWGYAYSGTATAGNFPWNNPKLYTEQSPLFHADKINSPLLLLHGGVDTNVPLGESIQMFNALKLLGKTVEFIEIEGENHVISAYKKRLEWHDTIFAWFAKWLKNEPEWWTDLYEKKP